MPCSRTSRGHFRFFLAVINTSSTCATVTLKKIFRGLRFFFSVVRTMNGFNFRTALCYLSWDESRFIPTTLFWARLLLLAKPRSHSRCPLRRKLLVTFRSHLCSCPQSQFWRQLFKFPKQCQALPVFLLHCQDQYINA